jgi:MFS family permease
MPAGRGAGAPRTSPAGGHGRPYNRSRGVPRFCSIAHGDTGPSKENIVLSRFRLLTRFTLAETDLLRDATYRRLWTSILISSFGGQVTLLALPLSAAVLLHAGPTQMGLLTAMEIAPFVLFSLPSGVWLDRVRKLPVYVIGELSLAVAVATVPVAWWLGWLSIGWLYFVAFVIGAVNTTAGSAAQIVLTQIVPRTRLVEAHAKNALASSTAEVTGPGAAGMLIKLTGAPVALLADAVLLLISASILRGVPVRETPSKANPPFWPAMREGVNFVRGHPLLIAMASCVGIWQLCNQAAMVVQILFATRQLGLSERGVGLSYVALGVGTIVASAVGYPGTRGGAGECARRGRIRLHAAVVRRRRGIHFHQFPVVAAVGDSRADAGPHDQHHEMVDFAARRAWGAAGRLAGRALGFAGVLGVRRHHGGPAVSGGKSASRHPQRQDAADLDSGGRDAVLVRLGACQGLPRVNRACGAPVLLPVKHRIH